MININEKTINDLQFPTLLETLSSICNTDIGKQKALEIKPFKEKEELMNNIIDKGVENLTEYDKKLLPLLVK